MQKISDFMVRDLVILDCEEKVTEAVKFMQEKNIGSVLVTEKNAINGIFTERDLLNKIDYAEIEQMRAVKLREVMTKGLKTVGADESYTDVLHLMQEHNIRHMPVEKDGTIVGMVSLRDLAKYHQKNLETALKEREEEIYKSVEKLKESEERFRTVFNNSAIGITVTDKDERIVSWNPFAAQLLGMSETDLRGKPVKDLYPPEEWKRIRALNIRKQGMKAYFETRMLNRNKDLIDIGISISVLKDAAGGVIGSIGIMRNITEHKKLEKIRQEFAGVVSHEFRTPLTPIREGVSQFLDGLLGEITPQQKDSLTIILQEIDRLRRIIDDLLDTLKLETGRIPIRKESADLVRVVNSVVQAFAIRSLAKGIKIKTRFSHETIRVFADKDRVIQVFTNLLGNALKFTTKGWIELAVTDVKGYVECSVADTGRGIAKEDLKKLFSKFQQVGKKLSGDEAGTGLGLVICKDIVELHKGEIKVESRLNRGTKFRFTFPKLSAKDLFREYIVAALESVSEETVFSLFSGRIANFPACRKQLGEAKVESILSLLEDVTRLNLRQGSDIVIRDTDGVLVVLPGSAKEAAEAVLSKAAGTFEEYLSKEQMHEACNVSWKGINFPRDGKTIDELLQGLGGF